MSRRATRGAPWARTDRRTSCLGDRGAVTVEAALALCALTLFLALAVGAVAAVGAAIRCTDAARELVRIAARGEPERARAVAAELAPAGAELRLDQTGDTLTGLVTVRLVPPLPIAVSGRSVGVAEPGAPPP
ncbi:MAG: pilus assembly protein [Pseudonocardia sp.]|nr:pilus assembly protein [Pseudonocardia sp.]